jgi:signal transduction histidine kinase
MTMSTSTEDALATEYRRLVELNEAKDRFLASVSHELRTPLTSILSSTELLSVVGALEPDQAELVHIIDRNVDRLLHMVDDLLLLARLDDDRAAVRRSGPVDLGAVAAAAVARPGRRLPVTLSDTPDPVVVRAGEDAVVRMLDNLLSNADRHASSAVRVSVCAEDGVGTVTVADDGPGIPAAERARVFERFARLDGSRAQDSGGSGLGLAIVRQLAQSFGGSVELLDAEPGLQAVVRLPLAPNRG